uniref:Uncharacterized protein n=1 Tax=Rhizophora mucronata TaxID=61149 RepID=A0A2P2M235_RHIMU
MGQHYQESFRCWKMLMRDALSQQFLEIKGLFSIGGTEDLKYGCQAEIRCSKILNTSFARRKLQREYKLIATTEFQVRFSSVFILFYNSNSLY